MKTIIFDLDGTLIDTEKIYRIFWPMVYEEYGSHMPDEEFLAMRSMGRPFNMEYVEEHFGREIREKYAEMRKRRNVLFEEYIAQHPIEAKPGAREALSRLKDAGFTLAIATATERERADRYLASTWLNTYFDKICCANEVRCGKPAPDVYLSACRELSVEPSDAYAVEDAPNGLIAAKRAGCTVVHIPDLTPADEMTDRYTDLYFENLEQFADYLCNNAPSSS